MPRAHKCQRFWIPQGSTYSLGDDGYLVDPEGSVYEKILQPVAVATEAFWEIPCIALLGEPGIGKSTTINAAVDAARNITAASKDELLDINLRPYGSEDRLLSDISASEEWKRWAWGTSTLYLFLDSMDECRLRIPTIASLLLDLLGRNTSLLPRVRLRIACRTADWPNLLERGLSDLFGEDHYRAYELLPLRRRDVEGLARDVGINPDAFMRAISSADAQPLAIRPITLGLLINLFNQVNALPKSKIDLYKRGCRQLCEETSESRQAAAQVGELDPDQRLAIARRIAALLVFCNKTAVSTTSTHGVRRGDILELAELNGGVEPVGANRVEVTERSLREVLGTALFTGSGTGHVGFAHRTYAEFLAADYLRTHKLDQAQLASLLYHRGGTAHRVVPQLSETAAWLASTYPQSFPQILGTDPLLLLRSDAATVSDDGRAALLGAILKKMEDGTADDSDYSLWRYFGRFNHPDIAAQLAPFITDKAKSDLVRRVAINIAAVTCTLPLQPDLLSVALDSTDRDHIRDQASAALAKFGDDEHRRGLLPLLIPSGGEDPDDQLRGNAMRALWPRRLIDLDGLLNAITQPRQPHLWGTYCRFLRSELLPHLAIPAELPVLLRWLCNQCVRRSDGGIDYPELSDMAINEAWEHLDEPAVCEALGGYILKLATEIHTIFCSLSANDFRRRLDEDTCGRRRVVLSIISRQTPDPKTPDSWYWLSSVRMVQCGDLAWLLGQAQGVSDAGAATGFANLAMRVFDGSDEPAKLDKLIDAARDKPAIYNVFKPILEAVEIDSPNGKASRERHEKMMELELRRTAVISITSPRSDQIEHWLNSFEAGSVDGWWQLNNVLLLDETGRPSSFNDLEYDLRSSPGWNESGEATRAYRPGRQGIPFTRRSEQLPLAWHEHDSFSSVRRLPCVVSALYGGRGLIRKSQSRGLEKVGRYYFKLSRCAWNFR